MAASKSGNKRLMEAMKISVANENINKANNESEAYQHQWRSAEKMAKWQWRKWPKCINGVIMSYQAEMKSEENNENRGEE
jgi:hypothetical protein